jgi:predicted ester cyclase
VDRREGAARRTHRETGRAVRTQEFAFYRVEDGKIAEVWGTADTLDLLRQIQD